MLKATKRRPGYPASSYKHFLPSQFYINTFSTVCILSPKEMDELSTLLQGSNVKCDSNNLNDPPFTPSKCSCLPALLETDTVK